MFYFGNLRADADGSKTVDLDDFVILKQTFGAAGGGIASGDFDLSGTVDLDYFVTLKQNFGASLFVQVTSAAASVSGAYASAAPARPHEVPAVRRVRIRRRPTARYARPAPVVDLLAAARARPLA